MIFNSFHNSRHRRFTQSGAALIFSILIVSFLLSIAFSLTAIFNPKIRVSREQKNSTPALYAAESALEWCLHRYNKSGGGNAPTMANGATYTDGNGDALDPSDCNNPPFIVIGEFKGITRALEASF